MAPGTWTPSRDAAAATAPTEYGAYQELLDDFLTVSSRKGEPLETSFDYIRLRADTSRARRFEQARAQILAVPPSRMTPADRKAWAINAYNYLIIEVATNHLYRRAGTESNQYERVREVPIERFLGPAEISGSSFFRRRFLEVEGRTYSFETFERHFLYGGRPKVSSAPADSVDPRIHFAVVNGTAGSPFLRPRVYRGDSLDAQLNEATSAALANPRHLRWDEATRTLEASQLFEWFASDFGGASGVMDFLRLHAPAKVRVAIESGKATRIGRLIPWDWKFNQTL
jgi:hypothetical protein